MSTITVTNIKATGETASRSVSGVAAMYVSVNQTTVSHSILQSFNTTSVTDSGQGSTTINFPASSRLYIPPLSKGFAQYTLWLLDVK